MRRDGLQLTAAKATLSVEWLAREVHPWDRGLPADRLERRFADQCLNDTHAAIARLFDEFPVLDAVEVRVRRNPGAPTLLAGLVRRSSLRECGGLSIGMRLRNLGVSFRMNDLHLDQMEGSHSQP